MVRGLGILAVLGVAPMTWLMVGALAERDYVAGALIGCGMAAIGHLGVALLALAQGVVEEDP